MRSRVITGLATTMLLSGCVLRADHPHNDVLLFATSTEIGVDIEASVQNGGVPDLTVGYERDEGVWMPLRPNGLPAQLHTRGFLGSLARALGSGQNVDKATIDAYFKNLSEQAQSETSEWYSTCQTELSKDIGADRAAGICLLTALPSDKYVSMASGVDEGRGGHGVELDTYSVFASFGARGGVGESEANGGLAQFFATGIAAQRLGANPDVGIALNTAAPDAIEKRAQAEESKAEQSIVSAFVLAGDSDFKSSQAEIAMITSCALPSKDKTLYSAYVQSILESLDDGDPTKDEIADLADVDDSTFRGNLALGPEVRAEFIKKYPENCTQE